jgi:DNA-binding CsgD family transcriptional regulator
MTTDFTTGWRAVGTRGRLPLVEREHGLAELDALAYDAVRGEGRILLIEGAAGVGKTRLLHEARRIAGDRGVSVLSARAGELERDFGFGVIRQLLEPVLARLDAEPRAELFTGAARLAAPVFAADPAEPDPGANPADGILHGLYWLVVNLSERAPLLLSIDDVQWADEASQRFVLYLARRLDGLPVAIVLAARTGEEPVNAQLSRQLAMEVSGPRLRPRPLSAEAVEVIVRAELAEDASAELCVACHEATGGNPFFVSELLAELRSAGLTGETVSAEAVRSLAPDRIAASLLLRVGRLDPAAPRLARAVAVLGAEADPDRAADLAALDACDARAVARLLVDGSVLEHGEPFRFVHPIARTAVYEEMPAAERARLHRRAADLLAAGGAGPETIAVHLLATDPAANRQSVAQLRAAAEAALTRGSPETAVRYLRRALREPAADAELRDVHAELGSASWILGDPAALDHLRTAVALAEPGVPRARATIALTTALSHVEADEAAVRLEGAIDALPPGADELARELEVELAAVGHFTRRAYVRAAGRLERFASDRIGRTTTDRKLLASLAFERAINGRATEAADLAVRAFEAGLLADYIGGAIQECEAVVSLIYAERFAAADHYLETALRQARQWGSLTGVVLSTRFMSLAAQRRGLLATAEARARESIEAAVLAGQGHGASVFSSACLGETLIDRGPPDKAVELLAEATASAEANPNLMACCARHALAQSRLANGQPEAAIASLRLLAEQVRGWVDRIPAMIPYRSTLALALVQVGEIEEARSLAAEEVALSRAWGTPRAYGVSLRAAGLAAGTADAVGLLGQAVDVLERSEARLEYARALVDLGAALRRKGNQRVGRTRLEQGMDLAHRCGAQTLVARAIRELELAGARPRRAALRGRDSLTPAELRASEMAATGMTNKQIAQALFVTLRTVEMHLSNAYGKLEISSRRHLERALAA